MILCGGRVQLADKDRETLLNIATMFYEKINTFLLKKHFQRNTGGNRKTKIIISSPGSDLISTNFLKLSMET